MATRLALQEVHAEPCLFIILIKNYNSFPRSPLRSEAHLISLNRIAATRQVSLTSPSVIKQSTRRVLQTHIAPFELTRARIACAVSLITPLYPNLGTRRVLLNNSILVKEARRAARDSIH